MRPAAGSSQSLYVAAALVLALLAAWGLRLTVLEGFVYAWPREFRGDFFVAMYVPAWWDGAGIMYGPVFVFERWLVNAWPQLFTIYFFALANVPIIALTFVLALSAVRANRTTAFVAFAAWCCFRWLFYAFSVAANPEILELCLLTLAWYAASRATHALAWVSTTLATLTKVIPVVFAPLLCMRASRRAIVAGAVTAAVVITAAGIGQHLSPRETLLAILIPSQSAAGVTLLQASHITPIPSMHIMLGLNSALARAMRMTDADPRLPAVQTLTNVVTVIVYVWSVFVAFMVLRGRHALDEVTRFALAYGLFFTLMPLATFHTHPHTFIFMLPAWTAIISLIAGDGDHRRATAFGCAFFVLFVFGGMPSAAAPVDRLLHTRLVRSMPFADPIWANLATTLALSGYALLRTRSPSAPV